MYKLRESRLKDFYITGDMDSTSGIGLTKTPLTPSHGESLVDQSFQSFKTKEIRDSESPTREIKYTTRPSGVIAPDTSGWNVVTSSEISPDGKAYKTESLATTEGVKKLSGGHSQFSGMNEQLSKASYEGDDKNYVRTAGESSKTHLQESSVVGDENSGRTESKSNTVVSSSSHQTTSKFTSSGDDFEPIVDKDQILQQFDKLADSAMTKLSKSRQSQSQEQQQHHHHHTSNVESRSSTVKEERQHQHHEEKQHQYQQVQKERHVTEGLTNQEHLQTNQASSTNKVEKVYEQRPKVTKVYLEEEVEKLAALPGNLISRKIDYPDPNTKMITETKELPDGTIVTTKRYETKSARAKAFKSDLQQEQVSSTQSHQSKISKETEIQDKTTSKRNQNIDTSATNRYTDRRTSEFTDEADRRSSEIRREDIQKQKTQQQKIHEQVSRNESFQKQETSSVHSEETRHHESNVRDHQTRDTVDRTNRRLDQFENLKDQVENIALDSTHRTVKKDLSQTMRNEKITNQDFIETEKGCAMIDRSTRVPEQPLGPNQQYSVDNREHIVETTKTVRKDSDFTTHGFPSVGSGKPQDKPSGQLRKPSEDFSTHGFPSVGPQRQDYPVKPRDDYTTHGYPSSRSHIESTRRKEDYETRNIDESYSTHQTVESKTNKTYHTEQTDNQHVSSKQQEKLTSHQRPSSDFSTNGFPSVKPQTFTQEPGHRPYDQYDRRPSRGPETHGYPSVRDSSITDEYQTTRHSDQHEYVNVHQQKDFKTHGYPSTRPQGHPDYSRESPVKHVTEERFIDDRHQTEFETYGYPSAKPTKTPKSKPEDFKGTHGYPSVPSHIVDDASSVTTEHTEILDRNEGTRSYNNDYTSSRITVDVNASHDAFARSLRCVSPVDQQRPASSKSMRTSTSSVRSSMSPDKPSYRSPSRESGTYSESSRISSGTITKSKGVDSPRRITKKSTPVSPDSTKITRRTSEPHRSNETVDLTESKFNRHDTSTRSFKKTTEDKRSTSDYSGEKIRKQIDKIFQHPVPATKRSNYSKSKPLQKHHPTDVDFFVDKKVYTGNTEVKNGFNLRQPVVEEPCRKKYYAPLYPSSNTSLNTSQITSHNILTSPSKKKFTSLKDILTSNAATKTDSKFTESKTGKTIKFLDTQKDVSSDRPKLSEDSKTVRYNFGNGIEGLKKKLGTIDEHSPRTYSKIDSSTRTKSIIQHGRPKTSLISDGGNVKVGQKVEIKYQKSAF